MDDINEYVPSVLNPRRIKKYNGLTQNSTVSRCSLSLNKNINSYRKPLNEITNNTNKENLRNSINISKEKLDKAKFSPANKSLDSTIVIANCIGPESLDFSISDLDTSNDNKLVTINDLQRSDIIRDDKSNKSFITISSKIELNESHRPEQNSDDTLPIENSILSIEFGIIDCNNVNIRTRNSSIRNINLTRKNNYIIVNCELVESSDVSVESELDENMNEPNLLPPAKRSAVTVNLEIKKKRLSTVEDATENSKILILNTDAIENVSYVIVQPPNYKLVKKSNLNRSKIKSCIRRNSVVSGLKNGKTCLQGDSLKQKSIVSYLTKRNDVSNVTNDNTVRSLRSDSLNGYRCVNDVQNDAQEMSKNLGVADTAKIDRVVRASHKTIWKDNEHNTKSAKQTKRSNESPKNDIKTTNSESPKMSSPKRKESLAGTSPRKTQDSAQCSAKSKTNKTTVSLKNIPHFKIVAGTHFAVDAFSYGDIPNVKHYFLTHFHSDHYSGLKKSFNKILFCSKITGDLCMSRLGVNPKYIHILNINETILIEGIEVTSVDANHCPGALMLVFTLTNGKTILHTGDFRASPFMESYPVFWNKDINTIYLDTTYCNPRYDFPTQDQSLEMALHLLRQKKMALEKVGKKFSSVLIVCGTYTIGKEKFFLGMARRVGCAVWACPEKDRVLQAVEGRSFSHAPPQNCQLHVVPMRDLTHEKLRSYLESLQGAFNEVVAFKPSGWENGKNTTALEKDLVTIHGIPYSEHSSFSEIIRFVKFLKPKQVVPTVDISGGVKAVQKYFPCPLVCKDDIQCQSKMTDYFSSQNRQQVPAVT